MIMIWKLSLQSLKVSGNKEENKTRIAYQERLA